jgi:hypothetical protein
MGHERLPDVSDYHRVNAAPLPVDSALATVLRERQDWKLAYHDRMAVLFLKTNEEK